MENCEKSATHIAFPQQSVYTCFGCQQRAEHSESLGAMRDSPAEESALGRQWFWLHLFPQKGGGKKMESQARKKAYWSLSAQACRKDQQEVKKQLKST